MKNPAKEKKHPKIAIIGAGPAGLMAADFLSQKGYPITLFDSMPTAGKKFLIASKGGLNLTHSMPFHQFLSKYREREENLTPFLTRFGPEELRNWISELGFSTFEGSSGRVFPEIMNSGEILHSLIQRLQSRSVQILFRHKWTGWDENHNQCFETDSGLLTIKFDAVIFAFGGASWPQLGSDAAWIPFFQRNGIKISPIKPSNCGFETNWSDHFKDQFAGVPIKPVILTFNSHQGEVFRQQGEFIATRYGIEGSLIYSISALIREEIEKEGSASIYLDLAPNWNEAQLFEKLSQNRGDRSISTHLKKTIGFSGIRTNLLYELLEKSVIHNPQLLAKSIKSLPIRLTSARPVAEAISTAGGVDFSELDSNLMLKKFPGFFCAGEMLDWEAPTGGFLLTACFSTGYGAGIGVDRWLT
ncbi:MAG: aminoacetone oxidase family FAD-binding enzyme [Chloroflexi bacterium HGW-Chloroflexi-8]|nr:MAG: aminoacetone oxidase family FAD-binding enzyme [Chloroflexi bacterium HGW-Chloroflexi-8]